MFESKLYHDMLLINISVYTPYKDIYPTYPQYNYQSQKINILTKTMSGWAFSSIASFPTNAPFLVQDLS